RRHSSRVGPLSEAAAPLSRAADVLPGKAGAPAGNELTEIYRNLPLRFEVNDGQADSAARFVARGSGYSIALTADRVTFGVAASDGSGDAISLGKDGRAPWKGDIAGRLTRRQMDAVAMRLLGANATARVVGLDPRPMATNYFIGQDPARWRRNVGSYS